MQAFGLAHYHADVLVRARDLADFFEETVRLCPEPQEVANWVVNAVKEETNAAGSRRRARSGSRRRGCPAW